MCGWIFLTVGFIFIGSGVFGFQKGYLTLFGSKIEGDRARNGSVIYLVVGVVCILAWFILQTSSNLLLPW
jgi:hypothetical protein